jgi:phage terminase small subunit
MAVRGRKPKPLALKILEGYQADRTNFAEPKLPSGSIIAPEHLNDLALKKWNELAPILSGAGMLTAGDRDALEQLCDDYAIYRATGDSKAKDRIRRLLTEFGLTPSSRSRIRSTLEPPKNKLSSFIDARKEKKA